MINSYKSIAFVCILLFLLSCIPIFLSFQEVFRFLIICLCAIIALKYGNPNAGFITIASDFAFLFLNWYQLGIFLFCMVHIIYICAIIKQPFPVWVLLLGFIFPFIPLEVAGTIYAGLFVFHFYVAIKKAPKSPSCRKRLYLLALFLFACCDVLVALRLNCDLIWLFYTPSQILLAFNSNRFPLRKKSNYSYP